MSRMLTLIHSGWMAARSMARKGQRTTALAQLTRLLSRPDLPSPMAADARRLAAELLIESEDYAKARRHLRAAVALEPCCARTHYLFGLAHEGDPLGDDRQAALRFRKAAELAPDNRVYRAAFGRAAVRAGCAKTGVRALLAAAEAGPDDLDVLRVVVEGLIEAGRVRAARSVLAKARFLRPGSQELCRLWDRLRFETARVNQRTARSVQDARRAKEGELLLLPFVRVVRTGSANTSTMNGTIRKDLVSLPRPHFPRLRHTKADR